MSLSKLDFSKIKHVHCIGIGGIGVSGIAEILLSRGIKVSGSDIKTNPITERLVQLGATIYDKHAATNINGADLIVYSSAIPPANPEFAKAQQKNIPLIKRGAMLAELMRGYKGIAVSGTHGKTTTTGMLSHVLMQTQLDPTIAMGGILRDQQSNVVVGKSDLFVAEADESDASFLFLRPDILVITNIEADHLENYAGDFAQLKNSFIKMPSSGTLIVCIDDPELRKLLKQINFNNIITYGFSDDADVRASDFKQDGLKSTFKVLLSNKKQVIPITLNSPGHHNALNALATIVVIHLLNVDVTTINAALTSFPGVGRRFNPHGQIKIKDGNALLFDDYGHHPTELRATISAARLAWPDRRLVLVFQPHRYTRTRDLFNEFAEVLTEPDKLILLDTYSAGEAEIIEANGQALYEAIKQQGNKQVTFVPSLNDLPSILQQELKNNDVVFFQGAGSIGPLANNFTLAPPSSIPNPRS
jgi:UDP-N-acetylmuramate--alanine ligase